MHIAGGAAVAGLGGGNVAAGAAGAGVSAALAGNLNDVSNAVKNASPTGNADADRALGNIIANVLATGAGAAVGGNSGASIGSGVDMYNARAHCTDNCEGGTGQLIRDSIATVVSMPGKWNALVDSVASQFTGLMNANSGQTPPADANPLVDAHNGKQPPATGGAVVAPPMMVCSPGLQCAATPAIVTPGAPGYVPGNAIFNSGNQENNQRPNVVIDDKIGNQLGQRGWTEQDIKTVVNDGPVGTTIDRRSGSKTPDGVPRNDTASVYGSKDGYVVVNDRTGEVVQVSGKNDPGWIPDSRIQWK